ncbi:MAG: dTDP-4-dehydrorhamnose 3,5-epimerase family protein [Hyphomicrobium sp.]
MLIAPTPIDGVFRLDAELASDERGFFARLHCSDEFSKHGLVGSYAQTSVSHNHRRGTVRGMQFQTAPHQETKIVRCIAGAILDVVFDLRKSSPTYRRHFAVELSHENHAALYIPAGVAHGFQTLRDASEVLYMIDVPYQASSASGVRWNDPSFGFEWPLPISVISERDRTFPDWTS